MAALAVGLLCLAAYVGMAAPGPYWLDSSEFATAAFVLGIAHPPGHPLCVLLGKAFALLPLGPVALRVAWSQAACAAVAAAIAALIGADLARRGGEATGKRDALVEALAGAATGIGFGLAHAAVQQAVRPEVYALHAALALGVVLQLLRFDRAGDPRHLLLASLLIGLGLANHHFLTLLLALAAAAFVVSSRARVQVRWWAAARWSVAAALVGLTLYAYLPLRAAHHPAVDWGAPTTVQRFAWTVSARAFQRSLRHADLGGAGDVAAAIAAELSWLAPAVLVGAWAVVRLPALRPAALLVALGAASQAAGPALVGFDPANPDAYGYLEVAVALLLALCGLGPALLAGLSRRRWPGRVAGVALLALAAVPAVRAPSQSLARFTATEQVAAALIDDAPARALLVTSYYQTVFAVWYLRTVEGRRPDLDHVHRHFLAWPGYRDDVLLRRPELAPVIGPRDVDPEALRAVAARRTVLAEYDLDLPPALAALLRPHGLAERLDPTGAVAPAGAAPGEQAPIGQRLDLGEPETRRFVFWRAFLEAHRDCQAGRGQASRAAVARARELLGGAVDPDVEELARRCADVR